MWYYYADVILLHRGDIQNKSSMASSCLICLKRVQEYHVHLIISCLPDSRHAKGINLATIHWWNIFRLRKDKGGATVEFLETFSLNSIIYQFWHDDCWYKSLYVSERSKLAWFFIISSVMLQIIYSSFKFGSCETHTFVEIQILGADGLKLPASQRDSIDRCELTLTEFFVSNHTP